MVTIPLLLREQVEPLTPITEKDLNELFIFHKPGSSEKSNGYVTGFNAGMAKGKSLREYFLETDLHKKYPPGEMICFGRLDADTSGLLILAKRGKHPKFIDQLLLNPHFKQSGPRISKIYRATVKGRVDAANLKKTRTVMISGRNDEPVEVSVQSAKVIGALEEHPRYAASVVEIEINEGKYHQVKKMFYALGHPVRRGGLHRTHFGRLALNDLPCGGLRPLRPAEKVWLTDLYNEWLTAMRGEHSF